MQNKPNLSKPHEQLGIETFAEVPYRISVPGIARHDVVIAEHEVIPNRVSRACLLATVHD